MDEKILPNNVAVDRFRRRQIQSMTPEQRQQMGEELIAYSMELLKSSADGYETFLKRNFRQRRHGKDTER